MTEPTHQMGKIVTHDRGFCVTAGIFEQHNFGIYGQALIKKQGRYCPHNVLGDSVDEYFHEKDIGSRESKKQTINGNDYFIHCQKEKSMLQRSFQLMAQ